LYRISVLADYMYSTSSTYCEWVSGQVTCVSGGGDSTTSYHLLL